jgi:predicted lipoprotein
MSTHTLRSFAAAALFLPSLSCVPWTVRPLDERSDAQQNDPAALNPVAYIDSVWSAKLLPAIISDAVESRTLLDALAASPAAATAKYGHRDGVGPVYFIVKGQGRVLSVDTRSRSRSILVDLPPFDQKPEVWIQAGPILRGTSLRDATGLIHYNDFLNQLQYADAGNEMNDRVLKTVLALLDVPSLKGRVLAFTGTAAALDSEGATIRGLVPIRLTVEGHP